MSSIRRLTAVRGVVKELAGDPYVQGSAAQLAGLALVADGLVGLENPLDGKKSRVGIFGAVALIAVSVLLIFLGGAIARSSEPYPGGVMTSGQVVEVIRSSSTDGDGNPQTSCAVEVAYTVDGEEFTVRSGYSSDEFCSASGRSVEVSYEAENPAGGKVITSSSRIIAQVARWLPRLLLVLGVITFALRAASIVGGAALWLWGRRRKRGAPETDTSGLLDRLRAAWGSGARPAEDLTAGLRLLAGEAGGEAGGRNAEAGGGGRAGGGAAGGSPAGAAPPPGWYHNAEGDGERWWDGARWTDHVRTPPSGNAP